MDKVRKTIGVLLGVVSAVCLAITLTSRAWPKAEGFTMNPPAYRIDGAEPFRDYRFSMTFHNGTNKVVRLLGARESCGPEGCAMIENLPLTVPPNGDQALKIHFRPADPGRFTKDTPMFTDDPAQPVVQVRIVSDVKKTSAPPGGRSSADVKTERPLTTSEKS